MKVLLLQATGLHLGYLGCYGNEWIETPNLDRLAAEGVVFDQHIADGLDGRTIWSGRYLLPTGDAPPTPAALNRLGDLLRERDIEHCLLAVNRNGIASISQAVQGVLDQWQDRNHWFLGVGLPSLAPPWQVPQEYLDLYFREPKEGWDEEEYQEPAELDNPPEPLLPWLDPPVGLIELDDANWQRLQNTYAAVVSYLDAQVGVLLKDLQAHGRDEEVLLIFTAECGLALGEHGILGACRPWLHDELIHLPLLMRWPDRMEAGRRVLALTQPVDLVPTLLALFQIPAPEDTHGHNLLPLLRDEKEKVREYACAGLQQGERLEWALRTPTWSFILPVRPAAEDVPPRPRQLYVKPDDRWEVNNLVQHHLELADGLERTLRALVEAAQQPGPLQAPPLPEF